ncbi:LAME_0G16358g1_1 [Lachancea meyersii CBS 8951]|uniref:LAME_0G16358g1_1 n=1 Tax=Lachancea meyersii CBS 8951 TaxID=1266667 RepID=A0A1G4KB29_9SACH|nr:LAME_0G16358g1_1 [Lachancea meyersii CBS 8951]
MDAAELTSHFQKFKIHEKSAPNTTNSRDPGGQDMICNCEDELDIFERFVQDPCMDSWENLDEDKDVSTEPQDYPDESSSQWEDEEYLDTVAEGVESLDYKASRVANPNVCSKCHKLRRWKTGGSAAQDSDEPVLRCSRTNSFMSQLSRQASRQSLPDPTESMHIAGGPGGPATEIGASCTGPRSRSRSSFGGSSAIPAHLYCLERFVSCELDSAAECFFKKDPPLHVCTSMASPTASVGSPGSPTLSRVLSTPSSSTTAKNGNDLTQTQAHPIMPLAKRKSRVSSIELSLLNSMS